MVAGVAYKDAADRMLTVEPEKPGPCRFSMSASDTTQAALVQVLHNNSGGGFAIDMEADALVQGDARRDFGGFSDIIRKVFHHEQLSRQRQMEGESYNVHQPRLAVLLCGTPDQAQKVIKSESNGLFSRMLYYYIPPDFCPYKRMSSDTDIIGKQCKELQQIVYSRADFWAGPVVTYKFSKEQEDALEEQMQDKEEVENKWGKDIGASWIRMAIIVKRIAITLAAFQDAEAGMVPQNCWNAALAMLAPIKSHCIEVLNLMRQKTKGKIAISKTDYDNYKAKGLSDSKIAQEIGCNRSTIDRAKKEWTS